MYHIIIFRVLPWNSNLIAAKSAVHIVSCATLTQSNQRKLPCNLWNYYQVHWCKNQKHSTKKKLQITYTDYLFNCTNSSHPTYYIEIVSYFATLSDPWWCAKVEMGGCLLGDYNTHHNMNWPLFSHKQIQRSSYKRLTRQNKVTPNKAAGHVLWCTYLHIMPKLTCSMSAFQLIVFYPLDAINE